MESGKWRMDHGEWGIGNGVDAMSGQAACSGQFDGRRRKRVLVKTIGEQEAIPANRSCWTAGTQRQVNSTPEQPVTHRAKHHGDRRRAQCYPVPCF